MTVQICAGIRQVHKASEDVEKLQTEAANLADFKVSLVCMVCFLTYFASALLQIPVLGLLRTCALHSEHHRLI